MTILNLLTTNIYLYFGLIALLLIIDIILTTISFKKRKRDRIKKDFLEIETQSLENDEDSSKEPVSDEIMEILNKMEEDSKIKPEEVVRKFEEEQEETAIISYQELLDSVNNNKIEITEDDNGDVDFVQAINQELGIENNVEEIIDPENKEVSSKDLLEAIDKVTNKNVKTTTNDNVSSHLDIIDEMNDDRKIVGAEVISPVFGRITNGQYPKVHSNTVEVEQVAGTSTSDEIKKNEAFLKALIEFRNNL